MGQYSIEQSAGGVVTLYEKTVTGEDYITLKAPGINITGTKGFDYRDQWNFSHDLPNSPSLGGPGLSVQFGRSEEGTDVVVQGYSVDFADALARPIDFVISFDGNGNATNLRVGASFSSNGASGSAGFSIDPHRPSDASQIRSITYDPNGNTYVTQYNIGSSSAPTALVRVYGPTGSLIEELERPVDPEVASQISSGFIVPGNQCFLHDTLVQMWPLNPSIQPHADGSFDEQKVFPQIWQKPISEVQPGDIVVSYDEHGRLAPKPVVRTMVNSVAHILDFWGTGTTPGHAYYCADGIFKGQHVPIMDILRTDGAIMGSDGKLIRAATNCEVGSLADKFIHVTALKRVEDGSWAFAEEGMLRFGTRLILADGRHISLMEMAAGEGWQISDDGYMVAMVRGDNGQLQEQKFSFPYEHGETLPKPEAYILARSAVTLEEIYAAGEWEQIGTRMPAPAELFDLTKGGSGSVKQTFRKRPNVPPAFADRPDAPVQQLADGIRH